MFERLREQDKHFLMSLFVATGIIMLWKGIWEGVGGLPFISNPWVSLFIGLAMLTLTGVIYNQFDPFGSLEKSVNKVMHDVHHHPQKHEFHIKYYDNIKKRHFTFQANRIEHIEKNFLVIRHENGKQELFIPIHRVVEVLHKGKSYWRQ
jgi:uncharacterized protein YxeA